MRLTIILHASNIAVVAHATMVDLIITNRCTNTIWPAIATQNGAGPAESGFELAKGESQNLTVDTNWNGRVWGRTNCTFDSKGTGSCLTGDCSGVLNCTGIVGFFLLQIVMNLADDRVMRRALLQLWQSSTYLAV